MDERMQFVARRLAGEPMAELCREFGISRKTGYKIFDRYQECGVQGLTDRSRRPYRYANKLCRTASENPRCFQACAGPGNRPNWSVSNCGMGRGEPCIVLTGRNVGSPRCDDSCDFQWG